MTMVRDNTAAYEESSQCGIPQLSLASAQAVRPARDRRLIGSVSSEKGHVTVAMTSGILEPAETLLTTHFSVWTAYLTSRPEIAIVWIGANDVLAMTFPNFNRFVRRWKRLPEKPSAELFRRSLQVITHRLKTETSAHIGLCSLWPQSVKIY
jgi:hypothetical protein